MIDITPERQLQVAEAIALLATVLVTVLTHLMVHQYVAIEANPVAAWLIDTQGWFAFAAVRVGAVAGVLLVADSLANDGYQRIGLAGAWTAAVISAANLVHDVGQTILSGGLPETFLVAPIVSYSITVAGLAVSVTVLPRLPSYADQIDISHQQATATLFAVLMVGSVVAPVGAAGTTDATTTNSTTLVASGSVIDSFEDGDQSEWTESTSGTFSVVTSPTADGDYAYESPAANENSERTFTASNYSQFGWEWQYDSLPSSAAETVVLRNSTSSIATTIGVDGGSNTNDAGSVIWYDGTSWQDTGFNIQSGEYYRFQLSGIDYTNDTATLTVYDSARNEVGNDTISFRNSVDDLGEINWNTKDTVTHLDYITTEQVQLTQNVSGRVTTDVGTPVENATVHITGADYDQIEPSASQTLDERAQELYQQSQDPLPDEFDAGADIDSNVRNAEGEYILVNTYEECGDTDLQPQSPVVEPGGNPLCVSVWDASDEPGLLQGDDLTNQYPGQPVEGTVVFERLSPTGEVTDTYTFSTGGSRELNILGGTVMRDHEESVAMQNVAPGIYRITLEGSSHTQVRSIGDPQDLAQTMEDDLEDEAGQLTQRAQDIRENFNQSKFVSTEVTTNETGHYSAEVGTSVNMVAVEAYHTGGVNISSIDPTNFGLPSDAHPLTVARAWQDQSSYNGSIYLPSRPQEYEAPTSNADITLQEVSYTPHGNNSELNDRLANVTAALENASQQIAELQQQVNASRGNLEDQYQTLHDVAVNDDETYTRAEELLQQARGDNAELDINGSEATDAELRSRITVLEQAITEQRNTISADTQSSTSTDTVSAVARFGGELTEDQVDVIAHYSNGTSEPVSDEYISVDQTIGTAAPGQGSTEVTVNEYPLGDATSVQFEWLAARDGETATVRERVRNPTINADAPQVDSVRVSSLAPGPNERVTVELNPGENSDFRELTSATVYAPDGAEVTTTAIENGRETSFETSGQGTYTAQLTYTDVNGNNYTRTVRLQADDIDRDRPASVRAESGPTGVYALVADGLSDGGVSVTDDGDLSIAAGIPENADVPSEIHVYTNGVESDPSGDINVRVVRGENDEAVSERSRVLIHGQATPAENTYVYRNDRPVTVEGNQYGEVTHQSDQNLYSTYTDESGEVTITVNQPQTLTSKAYEPVKFQLRQFEVFGRPVPAMLKGLGGFGGLGLIGLFARRRRGDIQ